MRGDRVSLLSFLRIVTLCLLFSCGPLPRPKLFEGSIGRLPVSSEASGLVLTVADKSYTSSDVYFYDFNSGAIRGIASGESGDVYPRWIARRLWMFNRSSGRVSFSYMSPKIGATSRSMERRTPSGMAGDPSDVHLLPDGQFALGLGSAHKLIISDLTSSAVTGSDLGPVDTGDSSVPFRPGVLTSAGSQLLVLHQQLSETWKAIGAGRLYIARASSEGGWSWVDQNPTLPSTQGVVLNISNPVSVLRCEGLVCLFAGACYENMGNGCVGGVDEFDISSKTVRRVLEVPSAYFAAGAMMRGVSSQSVTACLKAPSRNHAELTSISFATGKIEKSWDFGGSFCGPFLVDQAGSRIFAIKSGQSGSELHVLNEDFVTVSSVSLPFAVAGMELVNE